MKNDEPLLKKYRLFFGLHVRVCWRRTCVFIWMPKSSVLCLQTAAEIIAILGFIIYATFLMTEFSRERLLSGIVALISAVCYFTLIYGINANRPWAHWPYFFVNVRFLLANLREEEQAIDENEYFFLADRCFTPADHNYRRAYERGASSARQRGERRSSHKLDFDNFFHWRRRPF